MIEQIKKFAQDLGYADVIKLDYTWKGYELYEPLLISPNLVGDEIPMNIYSGPPLTILVKGDKIRMSTVDEAYEITRYYVNHFEEE